MTAIAARTVAGPASNDAEWSARVLAAMRSRGGQHTAQWSDGGVLLASARHEWELPEGHSVIAQRGSLAIAADATLYYRDDLRRAITQRGLDVLGGSDAALILAAYEAFGATCVERLEGDFAFVLWDRHRRTLLAARDFGGKRTLHYCDRGGDLVLASTVGGVLADERVPRELNLGILAAMAASLWQPSSETCYRAVSELAAGSALRWTRSSGTRLSRFWQPPGELARDRGTVDDAAEHLRDLLVRATEERMARTGPTAVTLSGGWDSPAVFGAAREVLRRSGSASRTLHPVSISYPEGDPGREDEFITETTSHWGTSSSWIDVDSIAMFADARVRARQRDEPLIHPYEEWNRALSRASRATGARVMLDGFGGDQLFQVSDVFLGDLLKTGRWISLLRQWSARSHRGARAFVRAAVQPALSVRALRLLARLRGGAPPRFYLDRTPFRWFEKAFLERHGVLEREYATTPRLPDSSPMLAETHFYLLNPFFPRMSGRLHAFALDEGTELRSPLLDSRIVNFAVPRPWYEKADRGETKIVLRRSMRGLLPDRLLAPRLRRTGTTSGYFKRSLQGPGRALIEEMIRDSVLASIGMINAGVLQEAWEHYLASGSEELGIRVFHTVQAELWLRENQGMSATGSAHTVT